MGNIVINKNLLLLFFGFSLHFINLVFKVTVYLTDG